MSGSGDDLVTPELVLVDPALAKTERQTPERTRKAAMSSTEPSSGTFFVDPAQPAPATAMPEPSAPPAPAPAPAPALATVAPEVTDSGSSPMLDVPLGTLIFRAGLLAEEQLEDALQDGMRTGKRLGEVLLERGWLHERDLGRLLAGQKGLPFVEISAIDSDHAAREVIPEEKARLQVALPLRYEDGQLVVAVADPSNELVLENLRRTLGAEPRLVVAAYTDLIRAIGEAYATSATQPAAVPPAEPEVEPAPAPIQQLPEPVTSLQDEPEPVTSLQQEPEPVQSLAAPTPLPTVLPPAEERAAEPSEAPSLQPPVVEPPAHVAEEPPMIAQPAPPVEAPPTPLLETTPAQPEPTAAVEPAVPPLLQPPQAPLETPAPVMAVEPPVEAFEAAPMPESVQPTPLAPPPFEEHPETLPEPLLQQPETAPETLLEQPETAPEPLLQQPEPAPVHEFSAPAAATEKPAEGSTEMHMVLLRLREGDTLEVGTFPTAAEASARAQEVVAQIASAEGAATWPFFADRYLRPDAIVSVDLVEETPDKWMGSSARRSWASNG